MCILYGMINQLSFQTGLGYKALYTSSNEKSIEGPYLRGGLRNFALTFFDNERKGAHFCLGISHFGIDFNYSKNEGTLTYLPSHRNFNQSDEVTNISSVNQAYVNP